MLNARRRESISPRWLALDQRVESVPIRVPLANPLDGVELAVPEELRLVEGPLGPARLEWRGGAYRAGRPLTGCLSEFLLLSRAPSKRIEKFASRFGVLGICIHGMAATHPPLLSAGSAEHCCPLGAGDRAWEEPLEQVMWAWNSLPTDAYERWQFADDRGPLHWEPIEAWKSYARGFDAILTLSASIQQGKPANPNVWRDAYTGREVLERADAGDDDVSRNRSLQRAREALAKPTTWSEYPSEWPGIGDPIFSPQQENWPDRLAQLIQPLLRQAGLRTTLQWTFRDGLPVFSPVLTPDGLPDESDRGRGRSPGAALFPVLVLQLVTLVASGNIVRCVEENCRRVIERAPDQRRLRPDQDHRCDACKVRHRRLSQAESAKRRYHGLKRERQSGSDG